MTPPKPGARRRMSWTAREDENGLGGKVGYFTGTQWQELEKGATAAGFTLTRKVKGVKAEVPDVISYLMHLHHTKGATSN